MTQCPHILGDLEILYFSVVAKVCGGVCVNGCHAFFSLFFEMGIIIYFVVIINIVLILFLIIITVVILYNDDNNNNCH